MVGFVSGNHSFPKPLSLPEERDLLKRYQNGDETAKNILIEHNLRLVVHIVKKYAQTPAELDDYISIGTIGLMKAVVSFNAEKQTRLATYAARCIENEILMTIRAAKKRQGETSLQEPIGTDQEGGEVCLMDVLGSEEESVAEQVEQKLQISRLYRLLESVLKKRERLVLRHRYGLCGTAAKTQREVAGMLGVSRSYVSRIEKGALEKLRKVFG